MSPPSALRTGPRQAIGGTQEDVRRHNLATMLGHLHVCGPLRRADLTGLMGLNRSTIAGSGRRAGRRSARVREERPAGTAGRRRAAVPGRQPAVDAVQVLAVGPRRRPGVGRPGRARRRRRRRGAAAGPTAPSPAPSPPAHRRRAVAARRPGRRPARARLRRRGARVVRQADGNVRFAPNLALGGRAARRPARRRGCPHLPVRIGNDADLGALAEHRRGAARGVDDVVFIAGEEGVGCGLILGGRPISAPAGTPASSVT